MYWPPNISTLFIQLDIIHNFYLLYHNINVIFHVLVEIPFPCTFILLKRCAKIKANLEKNSCLFKSYMYSGLLISLVCSPHEPNWRVCDEMRFGYSKLFCIVVTELFLPFQGQDLSLWGFKIFLSRYTYVYKPLFFYGT